MPKLPLFYQPPAPQGPTQWVPESQAKPDPWPIKATEGLMGALGFPDSSTASHIGQLIGATAPLVTLLSKGQMLNNVLNAVEDARNTPLQYGVEALAEKSPRVLGHISDITQEHIPSPQGIGGSLGIFRGNTQHLGGPVKGLEIGNIGIDVPAHAVPIPAEDVAQTVGHEATHGAQALAKGPSRWDYEYNMDPRFYEAGAEKAGRNVARKAHEMLFETLKAEKAAPNPSTGIFNKEYTESIRGLQEGFQPSSLEYLRKQLQGPQLGDYSWNLNAPKPGGALDEVLSRAGMKSATGEQLTPGEARLLEHYTKLAKGTPTK